MSGRYPSDEFVELRPRVTWDRVAHKLTAREGARRVAVVNGGTIPDRGLFGVFLAGATRGARVGELDEEMVFESRTGDTVILGATTWRIEEINHNRVLVSPAPGEPGKMPFWHGDRAGRPAEFGQKIGEMTRELAALPRPVAYTRLVEDHSLDGTAAENLLRYLEDQAAATGQVPSDQQILIERCRDELGDWRICVMTPFGSRVHAPWCMAVAAKLREARGVEAESMWSDDGFVIRLPENEDDFDPTWFLPSAAEMRDLVLRQLGSTSLFAAKFREAAGRALLLPETAGRDARAAVAATQTRRRSDGGGGALSVVSDSDGNLPRMPERRVRSGGRRRYTPARSSAAPFGSPPSIPPSPRRLRRRCCSTTSRITSTKAMLRWRSGARRRCRSISRSSKRFWAAWIFASCWTRPRSTKWNRNCSRSIRIITPNTPTACTICC